jgi:hypothetical protein
MSTVPNLQRAAENEQKFIQGAAERQGVLTEALARRKQDAEEGRLDREQRAADRAEDRALRLSIANLKGSGYNAPKTQKERAAFDAGDSEAQDFNAVADQWKPEYTATIPLAGGIENFLARKFEGLLPEGSTLPDQAKWWSDYKERYELVRRHGLFGAALTKTEQAQWEAANIHPNDGPDFIAEKLLAQKALINRKAEKAAAQSILKGYDPEQIRLNFGSIDLDGLAQRMAEGNYNINEDAEGEDEASVDEELQEGDVIENDAGQQFIVRDGELVPL